MGNICGKLSKLDNQSPPPEPRSGFTPAYLTNSRASNPCKALGVGTAQPSYSPDPPDPQAAAANATEERAARARPTTPTQKFATTQVESPISPQNTTRPLGKLGRELERRRAQTWNMALKEYSEEQRELRELARREAVLRYD